MTTPKRTAHWVGPILFVVAAAFGVFAVAGEPSPYETGDVRRGAKLFARACGACHGVDGAGDGPGARQLDPRPRDLTTRHYRFRSTTTGALPLPGDLEKTIREGLPGTSMPGFGNVFSTDELGDLVAFIYSLQPPAVLEDPLPDPLAIGPLPEPTAEVIRDGQALYLLSGCGRCHGVNGRGNGPSAKTLIDDSDNRIHATDFRYDPHKRGREPEEVIRILRTGLNGTPMPSYDEALLIARGDTVDTAGLEGELSPEVQSTLDEFLRSSPTRQEIESMSDGDLASLRDSRMAALAYYVLSLSHRNGGYFWLFVQQPEREARKP
jgi:cytochrome c oxidase cbb3-type subunit 2